jgi:hypothetical protein
MENVDYTTIEMGTGVSTSTKTPVPIQSEVSDVALT